MIVWGGQDANFILFNTGGRYDPGTDSWIATSITNAPTQRELHTAVWTGSEMIIWGGQGGGGRLNTGGRYCAQSGVPSPTPTATTTPTATSTPTPTPPSPTPTATATADSHSHCHSDSYSQAFRHAYSYTYRKDNSDAAAPPNSCASAIAAVGVTSVS
jgi:hypothetical protein